jgi:hypothetical protein
VPDAGPGEAMFGAVMVNLYTNPQEDASVGVRHIPMAS